MTPLTVVRCTAGVPKLEMKEVEMDKDRIAGSAKQVEGKIKEAVGKVVGDEKLKTEGRAEQVEGKVQNIAGSVKDAVKDSLKP
jgi:uncharacterized protein YjbJ (UPF0337 family)